MYPDVRRALRRYRWEPESSVVVAASLAANVEEDWLTLRWRSSNDPFSRFLRDTTAVSAVRSTAPLISEAKVMYLDAKVNGRGLAFKQSTDRAIGYLNEPVK